MAIAILVVISLMATISHASPTGAYAPYSHSAYSPPLPHLQYGLVPSSHKDGRDDLPTGIKTNNENLPITIVKIPQNPTPLPKDCTHSPNTNGGDTSPTLSLPPISRIDIRKPDGQFSHGFSDKDGTTITEQGKLITTNGGWEYVIAKTGSYSYISPEGIPIRVDYVADENGFRATGSHIP